MDSYISVGPSGTLFSGDDAVRLFQAATLRSGLGLLAVGIKPNRAWTITSALKLATGYTGKKYKRTEIDKARADLQQWIIAMRSSLPIEEHK